MLALALSAAIALTTMSSGQSASQNVFLTDRYRVELRVPSEGVFAGEEVDIEFRVGDRKQDDPILGPAGVPDVKAVAVITMPSMAGMPSARPKIHAEGVPGDYGIEAFFPHGGEYAIRLDLTVPDGEKFTAKFMVNVQDEGQKGRKPKAKPYRLEAAQTDGTLRLKVLEYKTGKVVTDFDVAHEQKLHLLVASSDFTWFLHEHPVMRADGTWEMPFKFPYGGNYFVYADVAPAGKGSQILMAPVRIPGPAPKRAENWNQNLGPSSAEGITGRLILPSDGIPVGRSVPVTLRLIDPATDQRITDLTPWLGAMGHLMIFRQDGLTAVHSHPDEVPAQTGEIRFNARFPKSGNYRAFAQVQRKDKILTFSFTIQVKD